MDSEKRISVSERDLVELMESVTKVIGNFIKGLGEAVSTIGSMVDEFDKLDCYEPCERTEPCDVCLARGRLAIVMTESAGRINGLNPNGQALQAEIQAHLAKLKGTH